MNFNKLTPIEQYGNIYLKRDDLFTPYGIESVNGTKLRQCFALIDKYNKSIKGIVTGCSINSPQSAIVSYVAKQYDLPCIVLVGGTNDERIKTLPYLKKSLEFGANVVNCKSGRHTVLYGNAKRIADEKDYFIVEYGINLKNNVDSLINSVANQIENIPSNIDKLFLTCGSGITSIGVLLGIYLYKKNAKEVILIGNAPNRVNFIKENLEMLSDYFEDENIKKINFTFIDRYNEKGFSYNKKETAYIYDVCLHPNYEAKAWNYIVQNNLFSKNEKVLFWIVGSQI